MTQQAIPYIMQGKNVILVVDGVNHTISEDTHMFYGDLVQALKDKDFAKVRKLVEQKHAITEYANGHVSITGDQVYWDGKVMHDALATRLLDMFKQGFDVSPMAAFMDNLMKNPSARSVEQLYTFLERNKLPITDDGHFLAYKKVRKHANGDMKDIHSGTIRNNVGDSPSMPRNKVNDNPDQTCSYGLHFCSLSYLDHFGSSNDPIVIVKVNPADVVSVPSDYNGAKARCCKYEVVEVLKGSAKNAFSKIVETKYTKQPMAGTVQTQPAPKMKAVAFPGAQVAADLAAGMLKAKPVAKKAAHKKVAPKKVAGDSTYRLQRKFGGAYHTTVKSLADARAEVNKAIRGKKAQLVIVGVQTGKKYV